MRRGIFTLLSIIASGSLFPAEIPPWLDSSRERKEQQWAEYRQSHARLIEASRHFAGHRLELLRMKEGQVLLLNIVAVGVDNKVMQELAQKKNNGLQRIHTIRTWRFLDPKTGKQLWHTREYRDELQKFINDLVKPPFNKDEFGFAKPIYRDYVRYLPPIHFLIGKNGKVLDRWSSRKDKLTVEDVMKRVNKVAPKLKGE